MTNNTYIQPWSELLCCPSCKLVYSVKRAPKNLICGHLLCKECIFTKAICPQDNSTTTQEDAQGLPINMAVLSILIGDVRHMLLQDGLSAAFKNDLQIFQIVNHIELILLDFSSYLYMVESDRGATFSSNLLSRTVQRKVFSLLSTQLVLSEGRAQAVSILRSIAERVVSEIIIQLQYNTKVDLWTAIRSRGCQFLGPAMQEDVLRLICRVLAKGEPIARKNLVMYIVQTLSDDYAYVSKTCVGHVVQLLYRASCFNVIKREGESSLMQLKPEFRDFQALRTEHDIQIVQIAMEAGLRISPEQWSSLLYGDSGHRSHMQSIVDKLCSGQTLSDNINDLKNLYTTRMEISELISASFFEFLEGLCPKEEKENGSGIVEWDVLEDLLDRTKSYFEIYSNFFRTLSSQGFERRSQNFATQVSYNKTKLCPMIAKGTECPHQHRCVFSHTTEELRKSKIFQAKSRNNHNKCLNMSTTPASFYTPPHQQHCLSSVYISKPQSMIMTTNASIYPSAYCSTPSIPILPRTTQSYNAYVGSPIVHPTLMISTENLPHSDNSATNSGLLSVGTIFDMSPPSYVSVPSPPLLIFNNGSPQGQQLTFSNTFATPLSDSVPLSPTQNQISSFVPQNVLTPPNASTTTPIVVRPSMVCTPLYSVFPTPNWSPLLNRASPINEQQSGSFFNYSFMYGGGLSPGDQGIMREMRRLSTRSEEEEEQGESHISFTMANSVLLDVEKDVVYSSSPLALKSPIKPPFSLSSDGQFSVPISAPGFNYGLNAIKKLE